MKPISEDLNKKFSEKKEDNPSIKVPQEMHLNYLPKLPLNSLPVLSKQQSKVYELYYNFNKTSKEIALSLKISKGRVSQILKNLREKGCFNDKNATPKLFSMPIPITPLNSQKSISHGTRYWRLHDLHFIVEPYYFYQRYSQVKKGFGIPYSKWTITFNEKNIEIQLRREESFDSKDLDECRRLAQYSLNKIIIEIGNRYGFEVFKDKKCNIKLVNQHIAQVKNELAEEEKGKKIEVRGYDNKVWLLIDKSTGEPELEYVDPSKAPDDAKLIDNKYFNDLRYKNPPTNSELLKHLTEVSSNQDVYNKNIVKHLRVLDEMSMTMKAIRKEIKGRGMRFLSQPSRPQLQQQSSLLQY